MTSFVQCGSYHLPLDRPHVMAIINVTPDSFSGDGLGKSLDKVVEQAQKAVEAGASILDIGGESSRPGAASVSASEEIDRVIPALEQLAKLGVPVSIDTTKPEVMRAAIAAGASLINDINALREEGAVELIARSNVAVCLMHMQGEPRTMQQAPRYENVVQEVRDFLQTRINALLNVDIEKSRIILDQGFGFGKTLAHNLELFRQIPVFKQMAYPLLVGVSRKSMIGQITGRDINERAAGSVAAALLAVQKGASIVRVHDVQQTCDALKVLQAIASR